MHIKHIINILGRYVISLKLRHCTVSKKAVNHFILLRKISRQYGIGGI